jgi:hypothetical protein
MAGLLGVAGPIQLLFILPVAGLLGVAGAWLVAAMPDFVSPGVAMIGEEVSANYLIRLIVLLDSNR